MTDLLFGGIAGVISRTITAPFERYKAFRQNFPHIYGKISLLDGIKEMIKKEGVMSPFKGNGTNCIRIFPDKAIQFYVFEKTKQYLQEKTGVGKNLSYLLAGSTAGACAYSTVYPLEVIRSKLSIQRTEGIYSGFWQCMRKSVRDRGLRSLYDGLGVSVAGIIVFYGVNFFTYNYLKDTYNPDKKIALNLLFGSCGGIAALSTGFPFDTIKRKMHLSGEFGNPKYKGYAHCIKYNLRRFGPISMYRGIAPAYIKMIIANPVFFLITDYLKEVRDR